MMSLWPGYAYIRWNLAYGLGLRLVVGDAIGLIIALL